MNEQDSNTKDLLIFAWRRGWLVNAFANDLGATHITIVEADTSK